MQGVVPYLPALLASPTALSNNLIACGLSVRCFGEQSLPFYPQTSAEEPSANVATSHYKLVNLHNSHVLQADNSSLTNTVLKTPRDRPLARPTEMVELQRGSRLRSEPWNLGTPQRENRTLPDLSTTTLNVHVQVHAYTSPFRHVGLEQPHMENVQDGSCEWIRLAIKGEDPSRQNVHLHGKPRAIVAD